MSDAPDQQPNDQEIEQKFYRTVVQFEVLTEGKLPDTLTLPEIDNLVLEGEGSGRFLDSIDHRVTPGAMARLLEDQGSDPEFLLGEDWPVKHNIQVLRCVAGSEHAGKYFRQPTDPKSGMDVTAELEDATPFDESEKITLQVSDDLEWVSWADAEKTDT